SLRASVRSRKCSIGCAAFLARNRAVIPRLELAQRRVLEVAVEISPNARQVAEIARLAVALEEAGEDAGDPRVALRGYDRHFGAEAFRIEFDAAPRHGAEIVRLCRLRSFGGDIAPRILDKMH